MRESCAKRVIRATLRVLRIVTRQGEVEVLEVGPVYRKADVIVLRMQKQGVIN